MYCPNCELEIKGEEKNECPICNTPLIENPYQSDGGSAGADSEQDKVKELIEDIEEKISFSEEDSASSSELTIEDPSEKEFELEEQEPSDVIEPSDERAFSFEEDSAAENKDEPQPAESERPLSEETEPTMEIEPEQAGPEDSEAGLEGKLLPEREETESTQADETRDIAGFSDEQADTEPDIEQELNEIQAETGKDEEADLFDKEDTVITGGTDGQEAESTKDVLDRALNELDDGEEPIGGNGRKKNVGALAGFIVILCVALGAGGYYYYTAGQKESVPEPQKKITQSVTRKKPAKAADQKQQQKKAAVSIKKEKPSDKRSFAAKGDTIEASAKPPAQIVEEKAGKEIEKAPVAKKEGQPEKTSPADESTVPPAEKKQAPSGGKEKKTTETPVKADAQKPSVPEKPYSIHAGSYKKRSVAEGEVKRFSGKGFDAFVKEVDLGKKGTWYRVMVGNYATKNMARAAQKEVGRYINLQTRILKIK